MFPAAVEDSLQFLHIWLQEKDFSLTVDRPSDLSDFKILVLFPENDMRNFFGTHNRFCHSALTLSPPSLLYGENIGPYKLAQNY